MKKLVKKLMGKNSSEAENNTGNVQQYHLKTLEAIEPFVIENVGQVHAVDKNNFAILDSITCYNVEVWEECMRLPHWHPNACELGYIVSGELEVIIWRSPGETSVVSLKPGMCWFIPQAALHSLNNVGSEVAKLIIGFSSDIPQDIDLPVAFNGIPAPLRDAYTSPHSELRDWQGTTKNVFFGKYTPQPELHKVLTGSPYGFDLQQVTPLFDDPRLGSVMWGVKSNWSILEDISILRAHLKPGTARDPIWYPDAGTLYIVSKGSGQYHIIVKDTDPEPLEVKKYDFIFVPCGVLHTFINNSDEDFEVIAFFSKADPLPEVSLSVSTGFFPKTISNAALTEYGTEHKGGEPLKDLKNTYRTPYIVPIKTQ